MNDDDGDISDEWDVRDADRDEFVELFTQKNQVDRQLRKFKRPYRPSQGKKRWQNAPSASSNQSSFQSGKGQSKGKPFGRRVFFMDDNGDLQEFEPNDAEIMFASKSNNNSAVPGRNPINTKTGKRMLCNICNSPDHFERECPKNPKRVHVCDVDESKNFFVSELAESEGELEELEDFAF